MDAVGCAMPEFRTNDTTLIDANYTVKTRQVAQILKALQTASFFALHCKILGK